jgi:hypothetical protein
MPVLRQRLDGGYYIRGCIPGTGSFCTWQVTPEGVALLRRSGITDGDKVSDAVLRELRNRGLVYTYGRGLDVATPPLPHTPSTPSPDSLPLLFKEGENGWELQLVLPALPKSFLTGFTSGDAVLDTLERCGFRVDQTELVQGWRLWPGKGDATCEVVPHEDPYTVEPIGPWPAQWALAAWTRGADGLRAAGTLFVGSDLGRMRLRPGEPIAPGGSCYLVARHDPGGAVMDAAVLPIPADLRPRELPPRGAWSAWELHIPSQVRDPVREWFLGIGHPVGEPAWRLHLMSPPPSAYSPSGLPIVEGGREVLIAAYPPPGADPAMERVELLAERDAAALARLPVEPVASLVQASAASDPGDVGQAGAGDHADRPVYIAWPVADEGVYRLRAAAGRVAPLAFVAVPPQPPPEPADLSCPGPLELVIAGGSIEVGCLRAFVDGPGPHEVDLSPLDGRAAPTIDVRCLVPVDVSWSCGELRGQRQRVPPEDVQHLLAGDLAAGLANGRLCMLRVDAGNFGVLRVHLLPPVLAPMRPSAPTVPGATSSQTRRTAWRARWLAAAVPALLQRPHMPAAPLPLGTRAALAKLGRLFEMPELERITAAPRPLAPHLRALAETVEQHDRRPYAQVNLSAPRPAPHGPGPGDRDEPSSVAERGDLP